MLAYADAAATIELRSQTFGFENPRGRLRGDGTLQHAEAGIADNAVIRHGNVTGSVDDIERRYETARSEADAAAA